jgi:hypothetical protein
MEQLPLPQSDPKLVELAQEIEKMCQERGVAGVVCLSSSTHAEFRCIFPAWSLVQLDAEGYRVQSKSAEPERSEASIHLVFSLRDMLGLMFQQFDAVCLQVSQVMDIEHYPFSGLWDLDGWQKPKLPNLPVQTTDLKKSKRNKGKGFGK